MDANEKNSQRWNYVLSGDVAIVPVYDDEGSVQYMFVESDSYTAKCRNSAEVNAAIDIAMHRADQEYAVRIH